MKEKNIIIIVFIVMFAAVFGLSFLSAHMENKKEKAIYEKGYIDACKDFYKGKLKYELVENEDGTKIWKKIEKWKTIKSLL